MSLLKPLQGSAIIELLNSPVSASTHTLQPEAFLVVELECFYSLLAPGSSLKRVGQSLPASGSASSK